MANISKGIQDNILKPKPKLPFDDTSKAFYQDFFAKRQMEAEIETNVYEKARSIDLVVICRQQNRPAIEDTIFDYFAYVNDLEFKGDKDPLTLSNYYLILSRAFGLAHKEEERLIQERRDAKHKPKKGDKPERFLLRSMTLTMICVTRPDTILNELADELGFVETDESGVYHTAQQIEQWIIHPSELAVIPKNYPLLPLARGKTLEKFIDVCLRDGLNEYLELVLDLRLYNNPNVVLQRIFEVSVMNEYYQLSDEVVELAIQFFKKFPETAEPLLGKAAGEMQQTSFEAGFERGKEAGWLEGKQEWHTAGREEGKVLAKQDSLLHFIKYKFSDIPTIVLTMIEDNTDFNLLNTWTDIVFDNDDMEDIINLWKDSLANSD